MSDRLVAQRHDVDQQHSEPEVEIRMEPLLTDQRSEVTIGGRQNADVCLPKALVAERLERSLLQEAQQLALGRQREGVDLVEEEGAPPSAMRASSLSPRASVNAPAACP